jgi:hypothetical protein
MVGRRFALRIVLFWVVPEDDVPQFVRDAPHPGQCPAIGRNKNNERPLDVAQVGRSWATSKFNRSPS